MLLRVLILLLAVGAAGGAAWLTMNASQQPQVTASTNEKPIIPTVDVLVATNIISGGEVLSPDKMRWKPWPEPELNDQFITREKMPDAIGDLSGSFVNRAFGAGEPIRKERLMETNANLMSNKITPGKRAAAVKISAENTAGGFILPGDRVDVIHTVTRPGADGQALTNVSEIIISNVRVLAIDQTAVQSPEGSAIGKTATLELSPDDAERVMAAEASGLLSLVLRAVTDHAETLQEVLVVVDAMEEGNMLTEDNMMWSPVSNPQMHPQFIRRDEQPNAIRELSGSFVDREFKQGEALRESRIMKVNVNLMSHRLEPGMRAAAVKISAEKTAGGFILPGDHVDVIHTIATSGDGSNGSNESEIIIRNVRVLAIDQTSVQTAEGSAIGKTATLELLPDDAKRIMAAEASGILALALRSVNDREIEVVEETPEAAVHTVRIHRANETQTVTVR